MDMTLRHIEESRDMGDVPRVELLAALQGEYSDLVLLAGDGGPQYLVHRAIVCPRSDFLRNAVKDKKWKDDPEVVRLMVEYFYLLDYVPSSILLDEDASRPDSSDTSSLRTDAGTYGQVYGTSAISAFGGPTSQPQPDSFGVTRSYTTTSLTSHAAPSADFSHFVVSTHRYGPRRGASPNRPPEPSPLATREPFLVLHANMYTAAERLGVRDSPQFAKAIVVVYKSTPVSDRDMREAVIDALIWHSKLLDKPEIELAVMDNNGLAYELLKRSRRAEPEYEPGYTSAVCGHLENFGTGSRPRRHAVPWSKGRQGRRFRVYAGWNSDQPKGQPKIRIRESDDISHELAQTTRIRSIRRVRHKADECISGLDTECSLAYSNNSTEAKIDHVDTAQSAHRCRIRSCIQSSANRLLRFQRPSIDQFLAGPWPTREVHVAN
nr:hypothetical protein CFP56_31762 [Quercus suber]